MHVRDTDTARASLRSSLLRVAPIAALVGGPRLAAPAHLLGLLRQESAGRRRPLVGLQRTGAAVAVAWEPSQKPLGLLVLPHPHIFLAGESGTGGEWQGGG